MTGPVLLPCGAVISRWASRLGNRRRSRSRTLARLRGEVLARSDIRSAVRYNISLVGDPPLLFQRQNAHSVLATMAASDLLSYVRSQVTVDVDSMDPAVAARHTSDIAKFSDMTSNQAIVFGEASRPDRADLLAEACALAAKNNAGNLDLQVDDAVDILVCAFCPLR